MHDMDHYAADASSADDWDAQLLYFLGSRKATNLSMPFSASFSTNALIPIALAEQRYGTHFSIVKGNLRETDDLRVLDEDGERAFALFRFDELGPSGGGETMTSQDNLGHAPRAGSYTSDGPSSSKRNNANARSPSSSSTRRSSVSRRSPFTTEKCAP